MFGFGIDRRSLTIVLLIFMGIQILSGGTQGILATLFTLPGVLIAITFHEFAHAYVAVKLGDDTPKVQGRLNLNPISHIDPFGFMFLLLAGFGWGKPVEIDPRNFDGKYSLSKAEALVAAAGPIMNFILAFILLIIYHAMQIAGTLDALTITTQSVVFTIIIYAVSINIGLGVFNLIPLPPLDGSKILLHFLPYNAKQWFYEKQNIFYMVFLLIWITGLSSVILGPIFGAVYTGMNWLVMQILSIF